MTKYEALMAKYGHLIIEEHPMENSGLYADGLMKIQRQMKNTVRLQKKLAIT